MNVGTVGLSHRLLLSDRSYLRTVAIASYEGTQLEDYFLDTDYQKRIRATDDLAQRSFRVSTLYHHKLNKRHSIRLGGIVSQQKFTYLSKGKETEEANDFTTYFDDEGQTGFLEAYGQWKYRLNDQLTLNSGLHYSLLTLNNKMALEPRAALSWRLHPKHSLTLSAGLHSKMEHLALYTFSGTLPDGRIISAKDNLGLTKSLHNVLAYDFVINPQLRLKAELYYQYLYEVPVRTAANSTFSILNAFDILDILEIDEAVAEGTGTNMGIDLTLEKFFSNQYYFMATGSLYESKYTPQDGKVYNTRFNGNYQINVIGGKEFKIGKKKANILGLNGKVVRAGGNRFTPIDTEASLAAEEAVFFTDRPFTERSSAYFRMDMGISYRINKKRMTHTIMLDIQNVTNRENPSGMFYNEITNQVEEETQSGLFPFFNYRVEF